MNPREVLVALNLIQGLGPWTIQRLAEAYGTSERIFQAGAPELRGLLGRFATESVLQGLRSAAAGRELKEELERARQAGAQMITWLDPDYPPLLKEIHNPPPVLYVKGALLQEDAAAVALVGTRSATAYGLSAARRLGRELSACGITVVSGLAEGIDAAGHEGALEAGGRTIAVVGHGLCRLYPAHHRPLAGRIEQAGCLISEFPMKTSPVPENFPRRNRIISGLSLGVVVVEAPPASGALITAREAAEQGREVFAVPGPAGSLQSRGTHGLLKDGARLVETAQDILEELAPQLKDCLKRIGPLTQPSPQRGEGGGEGLSSEESQVFGAVPIGAWAGLEAISCQTALQPANLLSILTGLELRGLVSQSTGRGFSRTR